MLILVVTEFYRKRLFQMINELPTIFEVVTGNVKQPKDQSANHNNSTKSKSSGKVEDFLITQIFMLFLATYPLYT